MRSNRLPRITFQLGYLEDCFQLRLCFRSNEEKIVSNRSIRILQDDIPKFMEFFLPKYRIFSQEFAGVSARNIRDVFNTFLYGIDRLYMRNNLSITYRLSFSSFYSCYNLKVYIENRTVFIRFPGDPEDEAFKDFFAQVFPRFYQEIRKNDYINDLIIEMFVSQLQNEYLIYKQPLSVYYKCSDHREIFYLMGAGIKSDEIIMEEGRCFEDLETYLKQQVSEFQIAFNSSVLSLLSKKPYLVVKSEIIFFLNQKFKEMLDNFFY